MCSSLQPILALLGYPIAGNPSQYMFEKAFVHHELDWRYLSLEVSPEDLEDAIRGVRAMGFRGGNCAGPHKASVVGFLGRLSRSAELSGVVNCIVREGDELVGENTEGLALVEALRLRVDAAGKRVMLFGAGEMGRVAAVELAMAGVGEVLATDRDEGQAGALAELLKANFTIPISALAWEEGREVPAEVDVVIHAAAAGGGEADEAFRVGLDGLAQGAVVIDMAANSPETWLIGQCKERGLSAIDGLEVFITQAALDFTLWTGVNPDKTVMREAVEEFLGL